MSFLPHPDFDRALTFGSFRLVPARKLLLDGDHPVRLGSRAMELLVALVERAGQVLSREQLEAIVWPSTVVEETSLRVHVSALRKALRDGQDGASYIANVPGRGYCFVAPVAEAQSAHAPALPARAEEESVAPQRLPSRLTRMVGRAEVTQALGSQLARHRLVSIVGTGGIGKTTVALAVAAAEAGAYEDGVRFVDLAPISDPQMVAGALALAVGLPMAVKATLPSLCAFLADRRMLIVLDNCEHVLGAVAALVEAIMKAAPGLHVLTTSREPLYAEGEWIHRLAPLRSPAAGDNLSSEQALAFPAIQLFVERATAGAGGFTLSAETLPAVRQLCLQLDGTPLAIELAAARVVSLGAQELAQRLDELFQLLTRGRRTALSRHRTLEALIDWSHELLAPVERRVLARLSVFRSGFSLEAAASVAGDAEIPSDLVLDTVLGLAAKSLVHADADSAGAEYRLLYMTREYAQRKLAQGNDAAAVRRKHALHVCDMCDLASAAFGEQTEQERAANFIRMVDDIRAALDWAFSPEGDDAIAVRLTASVRVRIFNLGLGAEDQEWIERALERAARLSPPQPLLELRLCIAWCFLSGHTDGMAAAQPAMFERANALAELPGAAHLRIETLYSICVGCLGQGRFELLAETARRVWRYATGEESELGVLVGGRMQAFADHYLGRHAAALELADRVVHHPTQPRHLRFVAIPHNVSMRIVEARVRWLQGDVAAALSVVRAALDNAQGRHPFALSQALSLAAIPIALWSGDTAQASVWVDALEDHANRGAIGFWHAWVPGFRRVIAQMDAAAAGAPPLAILDWQPPVNWSAQDLMGTLSLDLVSDVTVARVESGAVGWCGPEILRAHGENLLRREGPAAIGAAQALFQRSLALARSQGAVSWELRTARSLAGLRQPGRLTA